MRRSRKIYLNRNLRRTRRGSQMKRRKRNLKIRVATCTLHETFDIHEIFDMSLLIFDPSMSLAAIVGYSEDTDTVFVSVKENLFGVSLVSMKPTDFSGNFLDNFYHPFTKLYTAHHCFNYLLMRTKSGGSAPAN
ncbi:hypothetical protein BRADI_2g42858v3 [Brachypodium distachyon]|uniref:Uncharacterized protein n=1 Tax=Brachypodium distachyon TaxID=15368 RepID=A0A0Q3MWC7_BRADI|nr:hypothetical protein BRADI_2g42858v3 [Brachypodium distachyon]